jgi:acetyltransferase-like isoleucine patch superfamily enzyme
MKCVGNVLSNQSPADLRLRLIEISGQGNHIIASENVKGCLKIMIRGDNNRIQVGPGVRFNNDPSIVTMHCHNTCLEIGAGTSSEGSTFHFREDGTSITVGEDCMIARDTNFWVTDFHSILDKTTGSRTNVARNIEVGNHVWIGWGAKILKNVHIGSGSIIGTSSVVSRDVAPHTLVMGVPAVELKSHVNWSRELL